MEEFERKVVSANRERELNINRLTAIDGIARKTAEAVHEIGIRGYAELARYLSQHTAQEVSAALKEHGVNRPPGLIERETWTKQAELFSQLENAVPTPPEKDAELAKTPEVVSASRGSRECDAVFAVSFDVATDQDREPVLRTTVCDRTNGGQEGVFLGSDTAPWVNWILEQAHLPVAVERVAAQVEASQDPRPANTQVAASASGEKVCDAQLEISDVNLSAVGPTSDLPEKRLLAEINFRLFGADAETLTSQGIPYRIEGYTLEVESGALKLVASDRSHLEPQVFDYVGRQMFSMPDVGRYEFHSIVLLLPPGRVATYHNGPAIKVIP